MIDKTAAFCEKKGLSFNPKKSKVLVFSKGKVEMENRKQILLNGGMVEYVTSITYLGVTLESNKGLTFSAKSEIRTFHRAGNSILSVLQKPSEEVLIELLYTNCVPIVTYACNVKSFSAGDMRDCNTAINDAIRKIFGFHRWESIRSLRESFSKRSVYEIFAESADKFYQSLSTYRNSILRQLYALPVPL